MNIKATSQQITNQCSQTSRSPLTFLPGHIFQGKITKLFPNHLASLSINGMYLTARLEASLTVGGRFWFEVQEGTGVPRLKVIENSGKQSTELSKGVIQQMIRELGLQIKLNAFGWKKITDYEQPSHKPSNEQVYNKRVDYWGVDIRIWIMKQKKQAVALRYDSNKQYSPEIIAKGKGFIAEELIEKAKVTIYLFKKMYHL
jgi:hypothetical protein